MNFLKSVLPYSGSSIQFQISWVDLERAPGGEVHRVKIAPEVHNAKMSAEVHNAKISPDKNTPLVFTHYTAIFVGKMSAHKNEKSSARIVVFRARNAKTKCTILPGWNVRVL